MRRHLTKANINFSLVVISRSSVSFSRAPLSVLTVSSTLLWNFHNAMRSVVTDTPSFSSYSGDKFHID